MNWLRRPHLFLLPAILLVALTSSTPVRNAAPAVKPSSKAETSTRSTAPQPTVETASSSLSAPIIVEDAFTTTTTTALTPTTTAAPVTTTTEAPAPTTTAAPAPVVHAARVTTTQPPSPTASSTSSSSVSSSPMESFILSAINSERSARGLSTLKLDPTLSSMAQSWSDKMGAAGSLSHSGSGIPSGFNAFGENVLQQPSSASAGTLHNAWMASSGHRANILQPGFDSVGIGTTCINGKIYATESFGHRSSAGTAGLSSSATDATPKSPVSGGPSCSS